MRRDDDLTRLRHMLDAARLAVEFSSGLRRPDLDNDPKSVLAIVKAVEIVGEAASRLGADYRRKHPEIPWEEIIAMRNRLVHAYFDIDLDILWSTMAEDLPHLISALETLLPPGRA